MVDDFVDPVDGVSPSHAIEGRETRARHVPAQPASLTGRVIAVAHQQVGVGDLRKFAQDLDQVLKTELPGSTGAVGKLGQTDFTTLHSVLSAVY